MDPGHLLASSSDAMPAAAFSKLSTNDDSLTVTLARPGAGEGEGEQMLDASLELQPRSPAGDRTVDEDAKIARLKDALAEGDTLGLRDALADVTGLSLQELRVRRQTTTDPRSWISPEGGPRVKNEFDTPLSKLIIASDVRLERWQNADRDAERQAKQEAAENTALARFCNRWCGCCQPEKQLHKPRGSKVHNQQAALQKKKMLGRTTLDDIDIPDFYNSPPASPSAGSSSGTPRAAGTPALPSRV